MRSQAYSMGCRAYKEGVRECPFPSGGMNFNRTDWWDGWYDTKIQERLGHIFERNGLKPYPPSEQEMEEWKKRRPKTKEKSNA